MLVYSVVQDLHKDSEVRREVAYPSDLWAGEVWTQLN